MLCGLEYETKVIIADIVHPNNREVFSQAVKKLISLGVFDSFGFYVEFTNDYQGFRKMKQPTKFQQMGIELKSELNQIGNGGS
jgi:hypothetical protein